MAFNPLVILLIMLMLTAAYAALCLSALCWALAWRSHQHQRTGTRPVLLSIPGRPGLAQLRTPMLDQLALRAITSLTPPRLPQPVARTASARLLAVTPVVTAERAS